MYGNLSYGDQGYGSGDPDELPEGTVAPDSVPSAGGAGTPSVAGPVAPSGCAPGGSVGAPTVSGGANEEWVAPDLAEVEAGAAAGQFGVPWLGAVAPVEAAGVEGTFDVSTWSTSDQALAAAVGGLGQWTVKIVAPDLAVAAATVDLGAAFLEFRTLVAPTSPRASMSAEPGVWEVARPVTLEGDTADATAVGEDGMLSSLAGLRGDPVSWPIQPFEVDVSQLDMDDELTYTETIPIGMMTVESGEVDLHGETHSCWYVMRFNRSTELTLAVTSGNSPARASVHAWRGAEPSSFTPVLVALSPATYAEVAAEYPQYANAMGNDLTYAEVGNREVGPQSLQMRANKTYLVRVATRVEYGALVATMRLRRSSATAFASATDVESTPGVTVVTGSGFTPRAAATVVVPYCAASDSVVTGPSGELSASVDLPAMPVGTYVARVSTLYESVDAYFRVLSAPLEDEDPVEDPNPEPTVPPAEPPAVGALKWYLMDSDPGGIAPYEFHINPDQMTSPHAARHYTVERTVAQGGAAFAWEGGFRAHEWRFSGILLQQAQHDALIRFRNLGRRFWLRDHRNRVWTVTFQDLDMVPLRKVGQPWAHRYTVSALIYAVYLPDGW